MTSVVSTSPALVLELPHWAQVTDKRKAHIARVTSLLAEWATALRISDEERRAWIDAGRFHDALKDAPDAELHVLVGDVSYEPQMLHGPAAAARLELDGETRRGLLDAVRYHTIGYLDWDRTGRALYMADFLEPGAASRGETGPFSPRRLRATSTACSSRSCARSSSGRCTRDTRSSRKPSRSGIPSGEAHVVRRGGSRRRRRRRECGRQTLRAFSTDADRA